MQCAVAGVVLLTGLPVCVFLTGLCWPWLPQILCCLPSVALPPSHVCRIRTVYSLSGGSLHCVFVVSSCKRKGWTVCRASTNSAVNKTLKQVKINPLHKLWHQLMRHISCVGFSSLQAPSGLLPSSWQMLLGLVSHMLGAHLGIILLMVLMSVDILSSQYWKGNRPCLQPPLRRRQVIKMEREEGSDIRGATSHCRSYG